VLACLLSRLRWEASPSAGGPLTSKNSEGPRRGEAQGGKMRTASAGTKEQTIDASAVDAPLHSCVGCAVDCTCICSHVLHDATSDVG